MRVALASGLVSKSDAIAKKGYLAAKDMDERQSALMEAQQGLASYQRQLSALLREQSELKARVATIPIDMATNEAERLSAEASLAQRAAEIDSKHALYSRTS